jgi:hypothetical protein
MIRPEMVIYWDRVQGLLADQKAAVGSTCIMLPQVTLSCESHFPFGHARSGSTPPA